MYKCKASKSPIIVAWLAELASEYQKHAPHEHGELATKLAGCLWGMNTYFGLLKLKKRQFSLNERAQADEAGHTFLYLYSDLARADACNGVFLWPHVPIFRPLPENCNNQGAFRPLKIDF